MFSRRGVAATAREIADEAGVNEVTLFRLFESKDQLLAAVVLEVVRAESEALDRVDLAEGQWRGVIRQEIELSPAVDAFTGMIFAAVLRRAVFSPGYTREACLRTCVDLFLQGVCTAQAV
jgi:AcrR family transcriptional regulator